jgi:hypothetical protein
LKISRDPDIREALKPEGGCRGKRFYAYYQREELLLMLQDFEILHE